MHTNAYTHTNTHTYECIDIYEYTHTRIRAKKELKFHKKIRGS